ncbi:set and mynd domain protein [Apiospora phragmitis]|uniref:Set and mynd domain protein n=1 Tax=Apiospora phragmitis TaxID=2905665 RepID=A0ABR1T8L6_9PEZI
MFISASQFGSMRKGTSRLRTYNMESTSKGVSVIANTDIPRSTIIIEEKPLFIVLHDEPQEPEEPKEPQPEKTKVAKIIPWQVKINNSLTVEDQTEIFLSDAMERTLMRYRTNRIELGTGSRDTGIFATCSRLNHSCMPSAQFLWSEQDTMVIAAVRHIRAGEEITIPYVDLMATAAQRAADLAPYGFRCDCAACADPTLHDMRRQALLYLEDQLNDYDLNNIVAFEPRVALGMALAYVNMTNSTGITGQVLDEAYYRCADYAKQAGQKEMFKVYAKKAERGVYRDDGDVEIADASP